MSIVTEWLAARAPDERLLLVGASPESARELSRRAALEVLGRSATFGHQRATLPQLAASLAEPALAARGLVPVGRLAAEAVVARAVAALGEDGLGRFAGVAGTPGFVRAAAATLAELRAHRVPAPGALAPLADRFDTELGDAGLADRATVLALAVAAAREGDHAWLGLPTLLCEVATRSVLEAELVAALVARAPASLVTVPGGDRESAVRLAAAGVAFTAGGGEATATSLGRLRAHLFRESAPVRSALDDTVTVLSAPGESRECVEIARRILREARRGVRFDEMAILLRSPDEYRPHLEEALARAGVPTWFARGAVRPDPAGRAFVALLDCAADGLSASAFGAYLSLGEVPDPEAGGAPPEASAAGERWVAPDEEMLREGLAEGLARAHAAPVAGAGLPTPRRWEQLVVDAAVIGGRARWERRLEGLHAGLLREIEALLAEDDDAESPAILGRRRTVEQLDALRRFALPLLDDLAALPVEAPWGAWLDRLGALASRALRHPDRVLSVLAELAPMAEVGPIRLDEVRRVLERRLLELVVPAPRSRAGRVFVAACESARGFAAAGAAFRVVFVPGLAERLFPRKIAEDPILLDAARGPLGLATNEDRVWRERLALQLAVGAAHPGGRLVLSYPRLDLDQSRPRVPSFYALEAVRAAEGELPGFDDLARRAEQVMAARIGWPAPERAEDAIDEAEHDLALLQGLLAPDAEAARGAARYLVEANPHLGRALRFRARRWGVRGWTQADGLVAQDPRKAPLAPGALEAIAAHQLTARSYSPTALQNYASCPYRFFLHAVHRLAPREVPEAIDELSPLQRGSLVHDVQFEVFVRLRDEGLLPVRLDRLERARRLLDEVLDAVAARWHDELAPAIERVWATGVEEVRADLGEWLRRQGEDAAAGGAFEPFAFELAFGLPASRREQRDPHSSDAAVALDCGLRLRGSIDLVERRGDELRVTDHKTGKARVPKSAIVWGGEALQPVLYALAAEKLFPETRVVSGRLSYCTSAGGFEERDVPLDAAARRSAEQVAAAVDHALSEPFLPALPKERGCLWCDYRVVCGPYEEQRTADPRKWHGHPQVRALAALRELP